MASAVDGEPQIEKEDGDTIPNRFDNKTWKDDLTLVIEGKYMYVSKAVLALISPVFEKIFTAEFKEKISDTIELTDKTYEDFVEFLSCVYPGISKPITGDNAFIILPLAHEYQMDGIVSQCQDILTKNISYKNSTTEIYQYLKCASTYSLENLQAKCISFASERPLYELTKGKEKYEVPSHVQENVLARALRRLELDIQEYKIITSFARSQNSKLLESITGNIYGTYSYRKIIVDDNEVKLNQLPETKQKLLTLRMCQKIECNDQEKIRQTITDVCAALDKTTELFEYLFRKQKEKIHHQKEFIDI